MILNHKEAIQFVVDHLAGISINRLDLFGIHALLADGLLVDPAMAGRLRRMPAGIPEADREQVVNYVGNELRGLHEGNAIRYRPRPEHLCFILDQHETKG